MRRSETMHWAFDIDGVLVDTREAVRTAYRMAGVEQPDSAWGLPWEDWLPQLTDQPELARKRKSDAYLELVQRGVVQVLPMGQFAQMLERTGASVCYVTASSDPSATLILRMLGLDYEQLLGTNLKPVERALALKEFGPQGFYVDDRPEGADIARDAGWSFLHANFTWEP